MKLTRWITTTLGTAMLAGTLMLAPQAAEARVFISVGFAPPPIPVYEQPLCPGDGYIWTPGYWEYTDDGYEWVDGQWVLAPYLGALWTPGYWGYGGSGYFWNAGYWGPSVGYYGGINYGFGYFGTGFYGGYWNHDHFFYNREYNHFSTHVTNINVYSRHVDGFDGRPGGASFARGIGNDRRGFTGGYGDRGGTFNNAGNNPGRGGPGQNGGPNNGQYGGNVYGGQNGGRQAFAGVGNNNDGRFVNSSNMRRAYTNLNDNRPAGFNGNGNAGSVNQPGQWRNGSTPSGGFGNRTAQPGNQFGGFNGVRTQPVNPGSSFHPTQGANPTSFGGGQPRGNFGGQAPRGGSPSGAGAPRGGYSGGGGMPHGGGGSPHGGGHR